MNGDNGDREAIAVSERGNNSDSTRVRTTIGIKMTTKARLDKNRAPGQCYDGFLGQLIDLWERQNSKRTIYSKVHKRG